VRPWWLGDITRPGARILWTLKAKLVYHPHFADRCQAHPELFDYIETFYKPEEAALGSRVREPC
jgi:hypothetical protein